MKSRLYLLWNLIFGLFVLSRNAEAARATTLILGKSKPEPKIDAVLTADNNNETIASIPTSAAVLSNDTSPGENVPPTNGTKLTGVPQIDYIYDPNLPRELNGYNLSDYPFYNSVPEDIDFKCDGLHDGFYASVTHKCQVYHHCLFGTRYDFLCANYTAFDQKTFICHFASEVDCKNSPKYFNRNEALYKAATTTTAAAPSSAGRRPPGSRRRRPYHRKKKPTYEYYDDYEDFRSQDYYEDDEEDSQSSSPPPPPPPPSPRRKKRPRPNSNNRENYMKPEKLEQERREETFSEEKEETIVVPPSGPNKSFAGDPPRLASKSKRPQNGADPNRGSKVENGKNRHDHFEPNGDYESRTKDHHTRLSNNYKYSEERGPVPNRNRGEIQTNHREKARVGEERDERPSLHMKKRKPPSSYEQFNYEEEEEIESRPLKNRAKGEEARHWESEENFKTKKRKEEQEQGGGEADEDEDEDDADYYYYYSRNKTLKKNSAEKEKINREPPHKSAQHTAPDFEDDNDDIGPVEMRKGNQNYNGKSKQYSTDEETRRDYEDDGVGDGDKDDVDDDEDDDDDAIVENKKSHRISQENLDDLTDEREESPTTRNNNRNYFNRHKAATKTWTKARESLPPRNEEKQRNREKPVSADVDDYDEVIPQNPRNQNGAPLRLKNKSPGIIQRISTGVNKNSKESRENDNSPVPAPRPAYITEITASNGGKRTNSMKNKYLNVATDSFSKQPVAGLDESYANLKRPQNKNVAQNIPQQQFRTSSQEASSPEEETDYREEQEVEAIFKSKEKVEQDGNKKSRLKVPLENLNDSQELAPRAPPSTTVFPLSLRRRPFLPSRGGSIPRGLLPVGGRKSSSPNLQQGNSRPREQHEQPQENLKPVDRNGVLEFRTKVSASIGVEQPQLTSLAAESAPSFAARTRRPVIINSRETETLYSSPHNQQQSEERNLDRGTMDDSSSSPYLIHNNAPRYHDDSYSSAGVPGSIKMHFQNEKSKQQHQKTEIGTNQHAASSPFIPSSHRTTDNQDEPSMRLGPQTFYSENPKFQTTLVVPPALQGRTVAPSATATTAQNLRCNSSPHICIGPDQKSAETNARKTNNPFSYETVSGKFPKTDHHINENDDETYDESINDALQQFSTLHPHNVHRGGVNPQPQGFKRRYHQDAFHHLIRQPQAFETRLAVSSSDLYRSYTIPVPSLGFPGHHKPASLFFTRQ